MPGNENTKSGILQGSFICRTSELNPRGEVIQHSMITKSIERAQKKVEENNFDS